MYNFGGKPHAGFLGIVGKDWIPVGIGFLSALAFLKSAVIISFVILIFSFSLSVVKIGKISLWQYLLQMAKFAFRAKMKTINSLTLSPDVELGDEGWTDIIPQTTTTTLLFRVIPSGINFGISEASEIEQTLDGIGDLLNTLSARPVIKKIKFIEATTPNLDEGHFVFYKTNGIKNTLYEDLIHTTSIASSKHTMLILCELEIMKSKKDALTVEEGSLLGIFQQSGVQVEVVSEDEKNTILKQILTPMTFFETHKKFVMARGMKPVFLYQEKAKSITINNVHFRAFKVIEFPNHNVEGNFLFDFLSQPVSFPRLFTLELTPVPTWKAIREAQKATAAEESEIRRKERQGFATTARDEISVEQANSREFSVARGAAMFRVQAGVIVSSFDDITNATNEVLTDLARVGLRVVPASFSQRELLSFSLPIPTKTRFNQFTFTSDQVRALWSAQFGNSLPSSGVVLGINNLDGSVFAMDPFSWYKTGVTTNPAVAIFGKIGFGKSTLVKTYCARQAAVFGRRLFVIDPKGEYAGLSQMCGIPRIDISQHTINPLNTKSKDELVLMLSALASVRLRRELEPDEMIAIDAIVECLPKNEPTLVDFVQLARTPSESVIAHFGIGRDKFEKASEKVADAIQSLTIGEFGKIFGAKTTIAINEKIGGIIDLSKVYSNPDLLAPLMVVVTGFFQRMIGENRIPTILLLDEAWRVMSQSKSIDFLRSTLKLARSLGVQALIVTQHIGDFDADDKNSVIKASALLSDIDTIMSLAQSPKEAALLGKLLDLNTIETELLTQLKRGVAFTVVKPNYRALVEIMVSQHELEMVDTNAAMLSGAKK